MSAESHAVSAGCRVVSCFLHTSHYVFFLLAEARLESRLQSNWLMRLLGTGGSVNWMITATSLQILIGLMVIMSRLFLEGEGYTAAASAGPRAAEVCRAGPTLVILNVCRYVGCMKISWKCFEGRPLRGFYQISSKYPKHFTWNVFICGLSLSCRHCLLFLLINQSSVQHGSNHFWRLPLLKKFITPIKHLIANTVTILYRLLICPILLLLMETEHSFYSAFFSLKLILRANQLGISDFLQLLDRQDRWQGAGTQSALSSDTPTRAGNPCVLPGHLWQITQILLRRYPSLEFESGVAVRCAVVLYCLVLWEVRK